MRRAVLLLAACSAPVAPVTKPITDGPSVVVVVASGITVRRIAVTLDGARELSRFDAPAAISELHMANDAAALLLEDNRVAIATATGVDLLTLPPASTLEEPKPRDEHVVPLGPRYRMFTREGEVWYGRCQWGSIGLYEFCEHWIDVRLRPAPPVIETENGLHDRPSPTSELVHPSPAIAPSPVIRVELVDDASRPKVTNDIGEEQVRKKLRCSDGRHTTERPAPDEKLDDQYGHGGWSDIVWLSTEPPIFQAGAWDGCYAPCPSMVTFEGCKESSRFEGASVVLGPAEMIALRHGGRKDDDRLRVTLFWRGKELATITGADKFAFVR